ncbi:hypothetical protein [Wolbachia endosymbiont (group A) of Bibio marci]|uniref:hypothetical protein n=1 Tax=Wolbachia endosymbiont (group A) of Bibio marci TaxID=2953987 RepID=UPI0022322349|nr:hypothetical protein [Wolbachia endosymbiont (group A) of Bibio marci]
MSVATRFFRLLCNKAIPVSGHWDDTILFPGFQTGMTASLTIVIPLLVSGIYAKRYCGGMTVCGGMAISSSSRFVSG